MRIAEVAKLFAGSCVVYFVVAACSAYSGDEGGSPPPASTSSSPGDGATSPSPSPTNPVANALADGFKSGTRLRIRYYEGSDGSRQFIDFWDDQLKTRCRVSSEADGKPRCIPPSSGQLYFTDATCKSPAFFAVGKTAEQPSIAVDEYFTATSIARDHYTLGTPMTAPAGTTYVHSQGGCTAQAAQGGMNYYTVVAPLLPTAFVEMTIKTE